MMYFHFQLEYCDSISSLLSRALEYINKTESLNVTMQIVSKSEWQANSCTEDERHQIHEGVYRTQISVQAYHIFIALDSS